MLKCDLHMHTRYSYDTDKNQFMEDYCKRAIELGLDVICFTEHIECSSMCNTFDSFLFDERINEYQLLKQKYQDQLKVLCGYEVGAPHLHPECVDFLREKGADMIIGSIHYLEDPRYSQDRKDRHSEERIYDQMVYDMIECGNFDVVGHIDMLKKWKPDYLADKQMQQKSVKLAAEKGLVIEVNTSSVPFECAEPMPGLDIVKYYRDCGGKYVCVNSDSHKVGKLYRSCDEVRAMIPEGLKFCYFEKGKLIEC